MSACDPSIHRIAGDEQEHFECSFRMASKQRQHHDNCQRSNRAASTACHTIVDAHQQPGCPGGYGWKRMLQPHHREWVQEESDSSENRRACRYRQRPEEHVHPKPTDEQPRSDVDCEAAGERQEISEKTERREDGALEAGEEGQSSAHGTAPERELTVQDSCPCVEQKRIKNQRNVAEEGIPGSPSGGSRSFPRRHFEQEVRLAEHVAVEHAVAKQECEKRDRDTTEDRGTHAPALNQRRDVGSTAVLHVRVLVTVRGAAARDREETPAESVVSGVLLQRRALAGCQARNRS